MNLAGEKPAAPQEWSHPVHLREGAEHDQGTAEGQVLRRGQDSCPEADRADLQQHPDRGRRRYGHYQVLN